MPIQEALLSLAGLSLGDAFGQSFFYPQAGEDIRRRALRPGPWNWTDDTQMALSVVEELQQRDWIDQDYLARHLARRYAADPARGYGRSTRQILEGISQGEYFRSVVAVVRHESSGPLAFAAPIGGFFNHSIFKAVSEARLAAGVMHTHPEALAAAEAIAAAAVLAGKPGGPRGSDFLKGMINFVSESQVRQRLELAVRIPSGDMSGAINRLCSGDPSNSFTTVPFAIWCAAHNLDNYAEALWLVAENSGMPDSACAIAGGIVALAVRELPSAWVERCEPLPGGILTSAAAAAAATAAVAAVVREFSPAESAGVIDIQALAANNFPAMQAEAAAQDQLDAAELEAESEVLFEPVLNPIHVDRLTGLPNLVGLLDWFDRRKGNSHFHPFSMLTVQLTGLWEVNRLQGRTAGDDLLRWTAQKLSQHSGWKAYRTGGDKFAVILDGAGRERALEMARRIAPELENPGVLLPRVAAIFFTAAEQVSSGYALASLDMALTALNFELNDGSPRTLDVSSILSPETFPWMVADVAGQIMQLANQATEYSRLAGTDSVSQLPNQRAAMTELDLAITRARTTGIPLALVMMDGDNLRRFNEINYNEGDKVIQQMGSTLKACLRGSDFVARWRTGDEFLALLPGASREQAIATANRMCEAVAKASRSWLFPTTISAGVSIYPDHGPTVQDLLSRAERGLERAKRTGKNRVVIALDEDAPYLS